MTAREKIPVWKKKQAECKSARWFGTIVPHGTLPGYEGEGIYTLGESDYLYFLKKVAEGVIILQKVSLEEDFPSPHSSLFSYRREDPRS